jgi:transposase
VSIRIQMSRGLVKQLNEQWGRAFQRGDLRLVRRLTALLLVAEHEAIEVVAQAVQMADATIYAWGRAFILYGEASLRYRSAPGRPAKLTSSQKQRLRELITAGPDAAGYATGCWTSSVVQALIQREFGVLYNVHYLSELLRNLGFSYQKARFVSDHLDAAARQRWREQTWPDIVREARQRGAWLLFGDEASFAQWGSLGYTWALVGQQPLVKTTGKRKGYKVFGLIDYFSGHLFRQASTLRFTAATYCAFLARVLAQTQRPILLIQDGARYHTAVQTREFVATHAERLTVYQLPTYSPDYNPIEHLWRTLKRAHTHNRYFPTFDALVEAVEDGLAHFEQHPEHVKQLMGVYLAEVVGLTSAA